MKPHIIAFDYRGTLDKERGIWADLIDELRAEGHRLCVATGDPAAPGTPTGWKKMDSAILQSQHLDFEKDKTCFGVPKSHPIGYDYLTKEINASIADIVLIDDYPKNVSMAEGCGAQGIRYDAENGGVSAVRAALVEKGLLPS